MVCCCLLTGFFANGCATTARSVLTGVGTGAAVGAAGGALLSSDGKAQAALTSALVMGAIGGVAGLFTHKGLEDRDNQVRKETLFNLEKFGVSGFYNGSTDSMSREEDGRQKVLIITDDPDWSKGKGAKQ